MMTMRMCVLEAGQIYIANRLLLAAVWRTEGAEQSRDRRTS